MSRRFGSSPFNVNLANDSPRFLTFEKSLALFLQILLFVLPFRGLGYTATHFRVLNPLFFLPSPPPQVHLISPSGFVSQRDLSPPTVALSSAFSTDARCQNPLDPRVQPPVARFSPEICRLGTSFIELSLLSFPLLSFTTGFYFTFSTAF